MLWRHSEWFRRLESRAHTEFWERRLNIHTTGMVELDQLDYARADTQPYHPISYPALFWALDRIPFSGPEVDLVDYGCGAGRVVATAASLPYGRVTGVELSASLSERARSNLSGMRCRRAADAGIHEGDAAEFAVPSATNVFFFFNPFGGPTLGKVLENIRTSLAVHPREAFLIYFNPREIDRHIAGQAWIRPVERGQFHWDTTCTLYRCGP